MRKLDHCNIVRLRYFFYSSGEKVLLVFWGFFGFVFLRLPLFFTFGLTEKSNVVKQTYVTVLTPSHTPTLKKEAVHFLE